MPRFDPTAPYDVEHRDVVWSKPDGKPLLARMYLPVGAPWGDRPALVDVHGGAWRYFDRTADSYLNRAVAARGMVVMALDFRQAPRHQWPSAAADVVRSIRWLKLSAKDYGISVDDVGVFGGSSGGQLALTAALAPTDVDLGEVDGAEVAYALALWPVAAPDLGYRRLLELQEHGVPSSDASFDPERLIRAHRRFFGDEPTMHSASAQRVVEERTFRSLPPVWMAHAELDEQVTREMAEGFARAYLAAGGKVEMMLFTKVGHGFTTGGGPATDTCVDHMSAFIARQVGTG